MPGFSLLTVDAVIHGTMISNSCSRIASPRCLAPVPKLCSEFYPDASRFRNGSWLEVSRFAVIPVARLEGEPERSGAVRSRRGTAFSVKCSPAESVFINRKAGPAGDFSPGPC